MIVGVKYCGGCNPRYDRSEEFLRLKKKFPNIQWVNGESEAICDYWLIICGCDRDCVDISGFKAKREIILLSSRMDFRKAADILADFKEEKVERKQLAVGMTASVSKKIDQSVVLEFAHLTEDYNKLHVDEAFAENQWFQRPVAHGMLVSSLLSSVMGMKLPGDGTILMEENSKFLKPVFAGDVITARVTLEGFKEEKLFYVGEFRGECINQNGEAVVIMQARQMMMKNLFEIKEIKNDELREV